MDDIITNFIKNKYDFDDDCKDACDLVYSKICKYKSLIKFYNDDKKGSYLYYNHDMKPLIIVTVKDKKYIFYFVNENRSYSLFSK